MHMLTDGLSRHKIECGKREEEKGMKERKRKCFVLHLITRQGCLSAVCVKGILHFVRVYVDLSRTLHACGVIAVTGLHLYPSMTRPLMTNTNPQIITYPRGDSGVRFKSLF